MNIDDLKDSLNQLAHSLQEALAILTSSSPAINTSQISDAVCALSNELSGIITDRATQNLTATIETLVAQLNEIFRVPLETVSTDSVVTIPKETIESIQSAIPYLEKEQQSIYQEFIPSDETELSKKESPLPVALTILGLIVQIIFGILQMLPDKQLDRIIEQNDALIAQNEIIIQNQTELGALLHDLSNGLHLLADEIDSIRDVSEDSDNFSEIQGHADTDDTQQQNAN